MPQFLDLKLRRSFVSVSAALSLCWSTLADSRPSIFVPDQTGYAWWSREVVIRPLATTVGRVGVAAINAYLADQSAVTQAKVCFLDSVLPGDILSVHRATQLEIDETLREFPNSFSATYTTRAGRIFNVQVVAYQLCDAAGGATALLITNPDGSLQSFLPQEFDFTRILKRPDGRLNVYACFACGDVSELLYDGDNERFYQRWIGH